MDTEQLGRFGHHPDPAADFCVEVEVLEGLVYEVGVGLADYEEIFDRVSKALDFRVGGDSHAVAAKQILRRVASELEASP